MKRITKMAFQMAIILIPLGILLVIVGALTGANKNIHIGKNGKLLMNQDQTFHYEDDKITGIDSIKVKISNAKIIINQSNDDDFGVIVNLYSVSEDPTISTDNGILSVEKNEDFGINIMNWNFGAIFNGDSDEVIISIPKGIALDNISLNTNNGRIEINYITADTLKADTSNGAIELKNCSVNKDTSLTTNNGQISISGLFNDTIYAKTSNGKIIGDGTFEGKTTFKTSNGAISFKNNLQRSECNIYADTSNGSIKVNNSKVGDEYQENNGADNTLDLSTSNGGITITLN